MTGSGPSATESREQGLLESFDRVMDHFWTHADRGAISRGALCERLEYWTEKIRLERTAERPSVVSELMKAVARAIKDLERAAKEAFPHCTVRAEELEERASVAVAELLVIDVAFGQLHSGSEMQESAGKAEMSS